MPSAFQSVSYPARYLFMDFIVELDWPAISEALPQHQPLHCVQGAPD
jgi:hypothetical protein